MNRLIALGKASKMLGIAESTLRLYESQGILKPIRTGGNHRRYLLAEIEKLQGVVVEQNGNRAVCYCRVSSGDQKQHGDLDRQKLRVLEYCATKKYSVEHTLIEVCSGMKAKRPKLNKLYELVKEHKVDVVVIEHKDRLTRFMYDVFQEFFSSHNVRIEIIEQDLPKSFEAELVTDIMSLMTSFTATLHSRRKRQSKEFRARMEKMDDA